MPFKTYYRHVLASFILADQFLTKNWKLFLSVTPLCREEGTVCLSTDPTKVEAFYAHLGWNFWVFQTTYSKITYVHLLSNPKNANYVIISTKFYLSKIILELLRKKISQILCKS